MKLDVNFFFDIDYYTDMKRYVKCSSDCEQSDCEGVCYEKDDDGGIDPGCELYETGFTKVSKFLAFDLMPKLKVRTHKRLE